MPTRSGGRPVSLAASCDRECFRISEFQIQVRSHLPHLLESGILDADLPSPAKPTRKRPSAGSDFDLTVFSERTILLGDKSLGERLHSTPQDARRPDSSA